VTVPPGPVLRSITGAIEEKGALYLVLLDPDRLEPAENVRLAEISAEAGADVLLVGGSLSLAPRCSETIAAIKRAVDLPIVIFPGNVAFVAPEADAILFLSLVSGRNPQFLIGEHVIGAPILKAAAVEPIPTAYMLVEGGRTTSVEFMSATRAIPRNKPEIAMAHALAGQYLGMRIAFFDGGSGADAPVPEEMVAAVAGYVDIPVMVGGGIRTPDAAAKLVGAGARLLVTGDVVERTRDAGLVKEIADAVHGR